VSGCGIDRPRTGRDRFQQPGRGAEKRSAARVRRGWHELR
jgi:hypothetical protein